MPAGMPGSAIGTGMPQAGAMQAQMPIFNNTASTANPATASGTSGNPYATSAAGMIRRTAYNPAAYSNPSYAADRPVQTYRPGITPQIGKSTTTTTGTQSDYDRLKAELDLLKAQSNYREGGGYA